MLRQLRLGLVIVSILSPTMLSRARRTFAMGGLSNLILRRRYVLTFASRLGPHFTFDASRVQATLTTGLKAIRKYGTFYNVAVWVSQVSIYPKFLLHQTRTQILTSTLASDRHQRALVQWQDTQGRSIIQARGLPRSYPSPGRE